MLGLIDQYDDQVIFLLVLLEETGIPLPTPGDLVMLLAGSRAAQGQMHLLWVLVLIQVATICGASILFWLAVRGGRPVLYRYGRYIGLERARLDRAEAFIARGPARAVFVGRLTPGLRNASVLAAGVFGVPYRVFLPAFAVASFLYILLFVLLGYFAGPTVLQALAAPRLSLRLVLTLVVFLGLGVFLVLMYRRAARVRALERQHVAEAVRLETTALAGLVATLQMAAGVSLALYLLGGLGWLVPEQVLAEFLEGAATRFGGGSSLRFLMLLLMLVVVGDFVWAVVYTHVVVPRLARVRAWLRGLLFGLVPLLVSVLVAMPALGAGPLGLGLGAGLMPLLGELFRNALYGVGLALAYSLLRVARYRPVRAAEVAPG
jgi:membrane protein DedA with SNARE-associated domain